MAKKAQKKGDEIKRLFELSKIALDDDTCEMGDRITVKRIKDGGAGNKDNQWLVGRAAKRSAKKR